MILKSSQLETLRAIEAHYAEHGAYPGYEVLASLRGVSLPGARARVNELDNKGCLTRSPQLRYRGARRILSVDISASKCSIAKRVKRTSAQSSPPRRVSEQYRQEPILDGMVTCSRCHKSSRAAAFWWGDGTKTCTDCQPVEAQSVIDIEQDRRDEAAEMSWAYLAGRW